MTNTDKLRKRLDAYAPPGIYLTAEIRYYIVTMIVGTIWSLFCYLHAYLRERSDLFEWQNKQWVLMKGSVMEPFTELTEEIFTLFGIALIYTVIIAVYHYLYHYQGSKMMYLMRRLPDKWELHRRCLVLPIAGFCITIVYMLLLKALYYVIYLVFTPHQCLPL